MKTRSDQLRERYRLQAHPEGGWFAEVYTSAFAADGRPLAGSIFFLLDTGEISRFHQIDCEEIWYYHEGCGMVITVLSETGLSAYRLGNDTQRGERPMVMIPAGAVFAAENTDPDGYTFVSCATSPKFHYDGFRLIGMDEIKEKWPEIAPDVLYLAGQSEDPEM